jgi:hypothetical protein
MQDVSLPSGLQASPAADAALASAIVHGGVVRYIAARRERIEPFVAAHFSLPGTLRLHRAALGWDIARAPLNLAMAAPQAGVWLAAAGARRLGAQRVAARLHVAGTAHGGGARGRVAGADRIAGVAGA